MPVDQYIGGIEHAVLHLLYARFYTKVLRDLGLIKVDEPFRALLSQGMVIKDGAKMSKSKGNVVDPDDLIRRFGADTARLFSLFAAPPEKDLDWNDHGVEGRQPVSEPGVAVRASRRVDSALLFLPRAVGVGERSVARASRGQSGAADLKCHDGGKAFRRTIHETIKRVTDDIERRLSLQHGGQRHHGAGQRALRLRVGGARRAMPARERAALLREAIETTLLLLGPFCPHVTEELWAAARPRRERVQAAVAGGRSRRARAGSEVTVVLQVDGKVRGRLTRRGRRAEERVRGLALADEQGPAVAAGPRGRTGGGGRQPARQHRDARVRRARRAAPAASAILLGGCGYTVHGTLPSDINTIAVPIFQNRRGEPAIEGLITRAVVEAFSTNGRLKIVGGRRPTPSSTARSPATTSPPSPSTRTPTSASTGSIVTVNLRCAIGARTRCCSSRAGCASRSTSGFRTPCRRRSRSRRRRSRPPRWRSAAAIVSLTVTRF